MSRKGFQLRRRDEELLSAVRGLVEARAGTDAVNINEPSADSVRYVKKIETEVAEADSACLLPILPELSRQWIAIAKGSDFQEL